MGAELNKLMKQLGVGTPTMAAAPQMVGPAPVESQYTGAEGSPGDADQYATDLANFQEQLRKYNLMKNEYDTYSQNYQDRISGSNLYSQPQFDTRAHTANVPLAFDPNKVDAEGNPAPGRMDPPMTTMVMPEQLGPTYSDQLTGPLYNNAPQTLYGADVNTQADWYKGLTS